MIYGIDWQDLLIILALVLFFALVVALIWNAVAVGIEELVKARRRRHRRRH